MDRETYLANPDVIGFGHWLEAGLDTNRSSHGWTSRRTGANWTCRSLRDAAASYEWHFKVTLPGTHAPASGCTLVENAVVLDRFATMLRAAVKQGDDEQTLSWAIAVLTWGGVTSRNGEWLEKKRNGLAAYLERNAKRLSDPLTDADHLEEIGRYNAGMTKIYAMLLDSHVIYDSRVAAALCLMVRRYCEDHRIASVPEPLRFALPPGKVEKGQRGPLIGNYRFPSVNGAADKRHATTARSALHAAWLLERVAMHAEDDGRFDGAEFPGEGSSLRALEMGLFMMGYDVRAPASRKLAA